MEDETIEKQHPSFGVVSLSRAHGTNHSLFGSSITHNNFIILSIKRAILKRNLSHDWIMPDGHAPIVEVEMSATQFAEAITSFNKGEGSPCTITYVDGKQIPSCPFETKTSNTSRLTSSGIRSFVLFWRKRRLLRK
jgi:hypothetical protein